MKIEYEDRSLTVGLDRIERLALVYGRTFRTNVNGYNLRLNLADMEQSRSATDFFTPEGETKPLIDVYLTPETLGSLGSEEVEIKPFGEKKPDFSKLVIC